MPRTSPSVALDALLAGNKRFVSGSPEHPNQDAARRAELAPGQDPFAVVLGCSDSRLAAEIIFDQGLGDLFMVRTAGHVIGSEVLGSVEYATSVLGARLVVVLGHDSCGAVAAARAAVEDGFAASGFVRDVVERVTPSILAARAAGLTSDSDVVDEHIRHTADLLLDRSRLLSEQVAAGEVAVVGLGYALAEGSARVVTTRGVEAPEGTPAALAAARTGEKAPTP
ncbi:carbonic anhydrase [Streptomyces sp. NPDC003444]|uniref:carbonic anhydrase n=1 Tax=Streptomyces TaxID=1883 RepID=UPI00136BC2C4|nr:carbonic anhydrase [Streptomyces sp. SID5770]MZE52111.1 carbonic anhydrase [Streptomyces sp. SID5770]